MTSEQEYAVNVLAAAGESIVKSAAEAGMLGLPSGHAFAALASMGMTYSVYQQLVLVLVRAGKIRISGDRIIAVADVEVPCGD